MSLSGGNVSIAGAGPTGALLAIFLRRRGIAVTIYERRADPRDRVVDSGRSINIALAERGLHALKKADVYDRIRGSLVPMRGRMIHDLEGGTALQPYGGNRNEVIYSISRSRLNQILLSEAIDVCGATVKFHHEIIDVDPDLGTAHIHDRTTSRRFRVAANPLFAADGAGSAVRAALARKQFLNVRVDALEHGYKELAISAGNDRQFFMDGTSLHIWPRGTFMLIALPNDDGSFTATLFLQMNGDDSFASLSNASSVEAFFNREFPDVAKLIPNFVDQFQQHPTGSLATVYAEPWNIGGSVMLIGDSAHAVVPFHGQGMNCCFEDCVEIDRRLLRFDSWSALCDDFFRERKPNTDAIAAMAIENYLEMRERVADARYQLQKLLSLELERRFPAQFIPRYSMVSFHHDISYASAARRGAVQQTILDELTRDANSIDSVDFTRAQDLIRNRLST